MGIRPIEGLSLLVILLGVGAHLGLTDDRRQRNFEFLPEMVYDPAYEAHEVNANFADGRTLQSPPDGTIARGHPALRSGDVLLTDGTTLWEKLGDAERAAWDGLKDPWSGEPLDAAAEGALLARGAVVYESYCAVCHGPAGLGDGPVTKRGVPPPQSLQGESARAMSDGQMFRIITHGRANMASYASQVGREDRWKAIRFIRSLQRAP